MIVLHPDDIPFCSHGSDGVREPHVGFSVSEPVGRVKVHFSRMIVQQRPEDRVGEAWDKRVRDL